jgi:superfamily II DNA or RNA helicase
MDKYINAKSKKVIKSKTGPHLKKNIIEGMDISDDYKNTIRNSSYIGKKGYTISKALLTKDEYEFLKNDLFVKPQIQGTSYGAASLESSSFPVYRENPNKIYIPRFYGIQRYGIPSRSELEPGNHINLPFAKPLRDYQDKIVDVYINYVSKPICNSIDSIQGNGGILEVPCGRGKTVMALKIISDISKKALIIVHKEFLMNQWIERIQEFLPTARIGKIQGGKFDIEDKDIVIGMIQTIYDKEYPANAFSSFGITIVDEVHRIGSEQFSRTLFKTITPYMLGISATVDRKDKLTKVLYMFIGDKIYSEDREEDDPVCVRAIKYQCRDHEFNETEVDFRGKPKYSTMITKLCAFGPRSDFIIRVVRDLINENNGSQMMILCHNRSLLTYLYDSISNQQFATVGFYVGGMKQSALQETEKKQIVLATYAMAAEALDIKTLSMLVMITPKTDITQSVGRILRVKHEKPIIVDIVDSHDIFQNQWNQRRRYYKKCNYKMIQCDSTKYDGENTNWRTLFQPSTSTNDCIDHDDNDKLPISKCLIDVSMFKFLD